MLGTDLVRPILRFVAGIVFVSGAAVTLSCKRQPPTATDELTTSAPESLQPLLSASASVRLELVDAPPTELRVPTGIDRPATLMVVLGEDQNALAARCAAWHVLASTRSFVLCQSGPEQNMERIAQIEWYERALRLALRATKRRFGGYVITKTVTLIGLPAAADAVVALTRKTPSIFSRIALVQEGFGSWTAVDSARFSKINDSRALLVCSSKTCALGASRVAATLRASGVPVQLLPTTTTEHPQADRELRFPDDYREAVPWLLDTVKANPQ